MATPIIDHNLLTLDYWQDSVTYEGKTVPGVAPLAVKL